MTTKPQHYNLVMFENQPDFFLSPEIDRLTRKRKVYRLALRKCRQRKAYKTADRLRTAINQLTEEINQLTGAYL